MRQMKTAMDVRIRQQKGPSFQNPDQQLRQFASMKIRGSFALREEVIAELPEKYRKALLSMPRRQREQILSEIEKKIDRKIQSGTMAKAAARLDVKEQKEIQRMTLPGQGTTSRQWISSGQRMENKQATVRRYRLQGKTRRTTLRGEIPGCQEPLSKLFPEDGDHEASIESAFGNSNGKGRPIGSIRKEVAKREAVKRESARPRAGPKEEPKVGIDIGPGAVSKNGQRISTGAPNNASINIESIENKIKYR